MSIYGEKPCRAGLVFGNRVLGYGHLLNACPFGH